MYHILYVDDEEDNLVVFKSAFRRDYNVHTALSAKEGLKILKREDIKVLITDQRMPDISGIEFLKSLPPEYDMINIILTAYSDMQATLEALNLHLVYRYIQKPWDKNELKMDIDRAIETLELRQKNDRLAKKMESLNERLSLALEGNRDGVWDWDAATDEVYFSKRWKEMLGYKDKEIGNTLDEWDKRIHPADKEKAYADLNQHLEGKIPYYENEHRLLCKDGSYKWILDRGKVMSWTKDNKPLRVLGTHTDINKLKKTEEKLISRNQELEIFYEATVNRELMIIDLKKEINKLLKEAGKKPKYQIAS
jgi:PAS domain S-box-containing protein